MAGMSADGKPIMAEVPPVPNQDLIQMLERMLEDAKGGELQGLLCVQAWKGEVVDNCWVLGPMKYASRRMLGEMDYVKAEIIEHTRDWDVR